MVVFSAISRELPNSLIHIDNVRMLFKGLTSPTSQRCLQCPVSFMNLWSIQANLYIILT
ncbi:hypothetical protein THIOM_000275 [Candidatus Thiomargarita nelsonii]|uniref:Uncharacterized protein n=1 Tax=Candidatus Thiomargarita nelsonii TaxID=1003181 RepID=A0A176S6Z6_9GAMM|nr:hypothetical protein THIOM_000275 [Candidatus Thiomargarita nelsonii]